MRGSLNLDAATGADRDFDPARMVPVDAFRWNPPAAATGLGAWPQADSGVFPAGYVAAGRALADYLDAPDYLRAHLGEVGAVVPADASEAEQLRRWLQGTAASR